MNVLRISSIVVAWRNWQWDLSHGWQHDALGYGALLTAVVLLLSTDALLHFLFAPFEDHSYGPFAGVYSNPITATWNFVCGGRLSPPTQDERQWLPKSALVTGCLVFAVGVGLLQLIMLLAGGAGRFKLPESSLAVFDESVLSEEIEGFTCTGYTTETRDNNSNWGEYSNIWKFHGHGLNVVVSCDHPFLNWHYLNICYAGTGWLLSPSVELKDQPDWHSVAFSMKEKRAGRHGQVIYSHFAANGKPLAPVATEFSLAYIIQRLRNRSAGGIWSFFSEPEDNASFQVQLFAESGRSVSDEQFEALRRLHDSTRRLLRDHYAQSQSK